MQWLELKIPPLLVWLVIAGAMLGVAHSASRLSFTLPGSSVIALALVALGGALAVAGVIAFRDKHTTVDPLTPSASSSLVSGGVYRISRNPMYLGFLLALAGWAVYLSNAGAALLLPPLRRSAMRARPLTVPLAAALVVAAVFAAAGGCALHPPADAFPVELPESLDASRPLAVIGDLQQNRWFVRWAMKRESTAEEQPVLIADLHERVDVIAGLVIVGDLVYTGGSRSDWRHFDGLVAPIARDVSVLPAIGNHDYYCVLVQQCMHNVVPKEFRLRFPWFAPGRPYAVAFGDLMLAFIDSETELEAQGAWLAQKMAEWSPTYRAVFIFLHRAPFTDAATGNAQPDLDVQEHIVSRLAGANPLPVVITGHIHGYEHLVVDGVHYVITAGGGGPRTMLAPERPNDVYRGRECERNELGQVRRPFNYLLIERRAAGIGVTVRGFCSEGEGVDVVEAFEIPLP